MKSLEMHQPIEIRDSGDGESSQQDMDFQDCQEVESSQSEIGGLPAQLWKVILEYLYDRSDDPLVHLLNCRGTCKGLRKIAVELMRERCSFWNPQFGPEKETLDDCGEQEDSLLSWKMFTGGVKGTRLASPQDVEKFIQEMSDNPNPFPTGVVILTHTPTSVISPLGSLLKLVDNYHDKIYGLVYEMEGKCTTRETILEIQQFLTCCNFKNLKSLAIFKEEWGKIGYEYGSDMAIRFLKVFSNIERFGGSLPSPDGLKELHVFGKDTSFQCYNICSMFNTVVNSLTHLRCASPSIPGDKVDPEKIPALTHLKLTVPHHHGMNLLIKDQGTALKELSLKFTHSYAPNFKIGTRIGEVFHLLEGKNVAQSLETFVLDISEEAVLNSRDVVFTPEINVEVKYPKMKKLTIRLLAAFEWERLWDAVVKKMENLREVNLLIEEVFCKGTPKEIYDKVRAQTFGKLNELDKVIVSYYGWTLYRNGSTFQF